MALLEAAIRPQGWAWSASITCSTRMVSSVSSGECSLGRLQRADLQHGVSVNGGLGVGARVNLSAQPDGGREFGDHLRFGATVSSSRGPNCGSGPNYGSAGQNRVA